MELEYRNKDGVFQFSLHNAAARMVFDYVRTNENWRTIPNKNRFQYISEKGDGIKIGYLGDTQFDCIFRYGDYINIKK